MRMAKARVERLGPSWLDEVVALLCEAFHEYPVMRFVLKDAGADYDSRLTRFIAYLTDSRLSRGWPVLGVMRDRWLMAAANVSPPHPSPPPPSLAERYRRLCSELGEDAIARFLAFAEASEPFVPDEPHYSLGMIGVRRRDEGHGYARLLLDFVHDMSARDPESRGVALTTETPANLGLYEHFDYRIVGHARVDELETWTLFRPDPD